jgi:hypothetical protein
MKNFIGALLFLLGITLTGIALAGNGWGNGPGNRAGGGGSQPPPALNEQEIIDLRFLREEEKLARDTYILLYMEHEELIFYRIALSEESHMNAMLNMLNLYGIPDPVGDNEIGEFDNEVIQQMFIERVDKGLLSLLDALEVGVLIESQDIVDLQLAITHTSKDPLINSYGNLLEGSRRHLEAFENRIAGMDSMVVSPLIGPEYLWRLQNRCQQQDGHNGPR